MAIVTIKSVSFGKFLSGGNNRLTLGDQPDAWGMSADSGSIEAGNFNSAIWNPGGFYMCAKHSAGSLVRLASPDSAQLDLLTFSPLSAAVNGAFVLGVGDGTLCLSFSNEGRVVLDNGQFEWVVTPV